jgi:hypothetical protein
MAIDYQNFQGGQYGQPGSCFNKSLFGPYVGYIQFLNSDIVTVEGPTINDRLLLGDLRIPYKQVIKGRVILKPGASNVLLNYFSLGDNATFLSIVVRYDPKSRIEADNYILYNYFSDFSKVYSFNPILVLTGNSTHRIPQLYLSNPNTKYAVSIDVLVAVIDDKTSFFPDVINQSGLFIRDLVYRSIETYSVGESIVIYDNATPRSASAFLLIHDINSIERIGNLVIIDENTLGKVYLEFITEMDSIQALSRLNYITKHPLSIVDSTFTADNSDPVIYFNSTAGLSGSTIQLVGSTFSAPYNSSQGSTFSTSISLSAFGGSFSTITKDDLLSLLVNTVIDNRDGILTLDNNSIVLTKQISMTQSLVESSIISTGTYSVQFNVTDIALNTSTDENVHIDINII